MEMDWNIFSAIFQALGAIATFLAVIVALWQTKYMNRKRLKLSFTEVSQIVGMNSGPVELATLTVSNIGNRAVTVQSWGFMINRKVQGIVLQDPSNAVLKLIDTLLPKKIEPEETINLVIKADNLLHNLEINVQNGNFRKKQKVKVFCTDSVGKRYIVKTRSTTEQMIEYLQKKSPFIVNYTELDEHL